MYNRYPVVLSGSPCAGRGKEFCLVIYDAIRCGCLSVQAKHFQCAFFIPVSVFPVPFPMDSKHIDHVSPKTLNKESLERSFQLHFTAWLGSLGSMAVVLTSESIFH